MWDMNRSGDNNDENRKALRNVSSEVGNLMTEQQQQQQQDEQQHQQHSSGSSEEQQVKFDNKTDIENQSSCVIDSGFMSGPQLSGYDSSDESDHNHKEEKETTSSSSSSLSNKKLNTNLLKSSREYSDSGCAEEEDNIATDSGLILDSGSNSDKRRHMIVDSGVAITETTGGLSECFSNLSLKDNTNKLNDLNSSSKKLSSSKEVANNDDDNNSETKRQQQQQRQKQPWKIYYQQNSEGDTQLHIACITGYVDVICALIQLAPHPCLLDIQNDEALTALHIAVLTGQTNIVRILLLGGASPVVRDRNGNTPLHLACSFGDLECVRALTTPITLNELQQTSWYQFIRKQNQQHLYTAKLPQDLELRNYDGERCVHLAAQSNHTNILKYLVSIGADINAREGKSGRTPLHIAIEMCNENLANFLIEELNHKLNLEIVTYSGLTAYQLAVMVRFSQIQFNLEKHGAEPLTPPSSDIDEDSNNSNSDSDNEESLYNRFQSTHKNGNSNPINVS